MDNHPGDIDRERVLDNLRLHDVRVSVSNGEGGLQLYTLVKDDVVEVQPFPERISRHLIGRLAVKFGIDMASFFDSHR